MTLTGPQQDRAAGLLVSLALSSTSPAGTWGPPTTLALALLSRPAPAQLRGLADGMAPEDVVAGAAAAAALTTLGGRPGRTAERARDVTTALTGDHDDAAAAASWSPLLRTAVLDGGTPLDPGPGAPAGARWAAGSAVVLGAARGWSALPFAERRDLLGPDGGDADTLMRRAVAAALGLDDRSGQWPAAGRYDYSGWSGASALAVHPSDPGVLLGGVNALRTQAPDAVVSLCRLGTEDRPASVAARDHASFWLVDTADAGHNPNLRAVLEDAARTVRLFRSEGKRVLLHCVQAQSRTPTVAALYGSLVTGTPAWEELLRVTRALPAARVNAAFERELRTPAPDTP